MVAALPFPSTAQVLTGLRADAEDLARDLAAGTAGMGRSDALDLAEQIEDLGRQVDHLRLLAAHAVDLAAPDSVARMLVDHHASGDTTVPDPREPRPGAGAETGTRVEAGAGIRECSPLLTPADDGRSPFATAKDLLRTRLRISRKEAGRRLRLASVVCERVTTTGEVLPPLRPHVATALGELDTEASTEVVRVLERIDALGHVPATQIADLEATLVGHARTFDPDQLRRIGAHAVAVLDPDGAEPEETLARSRQGVHIGRLYRGLATVKLVVDAVQLEILQTAFDAGTNPRTATPPLLDPDAVTPLPLDPDGRARDVDTVPSAATHDADGTSGTSAPHADRANDVATPTVDHAGNRPRPGSGPNATPPAADHAGNRTRPHAGTAAIPPAVGATPPPADPRTRPQRQLDALVAATAAAIRHGVLPATSGTPTQLVVTIDATDLSPAAWLGADVGGTPPSGASPSGASPSGKTKPNPPPTSRATPAIAPPGPLAPSPGVALLPHAGPVPFRMVRHLACDATITAVVLGRGRRVLDLGQSVRIVPPWMRLAVIARDGTDCAFPGCTVPATWCEAHHIVPWSLGGHTSVANTVMLCPHHHKAADNGIWTIRQAGTGTTPTFHPTR